MAQNQELMHTVFSNFQQYLDEDQDLREGIRTIVRELEQRSREILAILQAIHQPGGIQNTKEHTDKARSLYESVRANFHTLSEKIPKDQYYRFHDHWRFVIQRYAFIAALIVYLETDSMISHQEAAQLMGVSVKREDGFHIELDDYLMGLLQLASELSRLAVNAVTAGDYGRPMRIAKFVGQLDSGFRLLNLKNDALRKRFDGLKYDLKKVEEVVYDVTIRGLRPEETRSTSGE